MVTVVKPTTVNTAVLPEVFSEALQTDLAAQRGANLVDVSPWKALLDAVVVLTRQLRMHGYYPEKVLVAIKTAVCDAAVPLVSDDLATEIVRDAAQSCIRTYFEPEIDRGSPVATARRGVTVPPGAATPGAMLSSPHSNTVLTPRSRS